MLCSDFSVVVLVRMLRVSSATGYRAHCFIGRRMLADAFLVPAVCVAVSLVVILPEVQICCCFHSFVKDGAFLHKRGPLSLKGG
jgi:hypothetical protein